ncbi:CU044_5270 family protein [Nonomuraea jabiensis]|uniref:CU044_5270 family protein n=1 Tax=Nonomuraea jabiensis TaxID=882448 RepID=UPI003434568D
MDDLTAIKELLAVPPPAPDVIEDGRTRMAAAYAGSPAPRRLGTHRRTARWTALAAAVLGTAAAVTAVVTPGAVLPGAVTPGAVTPGNPAVSRSADPLSARQIFLAAATSVSKAPAAEGAYWVRSGVAGKQRLEPSGRYTLEARSSTDIWIARDRGKPTWYITRNLGVKPATPQDEQAWRAAGSPSSWTYSGLPGRAVTLRTKPDEPVAARQDGEGSLGILANKPMTRAELAKLPTTPEGLREYLEPLVAEQHGTEPVNADAELYETGVRLLMNLPASPETRAAAYRMLASLPGTTAEGQVTDPLGRTGQAVSRRLANGTDRIIVDAETGEPLAFESTIKGIRTFEAIKKTGWTNGQPPLLPGNQ